MLVPKPTKPVSNHSSFITKSGHVPPRRAFRSRRGANMTLNNTKRPYQYVIALGVHIVLIGGLLADCIRQDQSESLLTNPVLDLRQPVRFLILFSRIHSFSPNTCLRAAFLSVCCVPISRTNSFVYRCLRARVDMSLSTRAVEDCGLLELPTG